MRKLQKGRGRITGVGTPFAGGTMGSGFMAGGALVSPPTTVAPTPAPSATVTSVSPAAAMSAAPVATPSHLQNSNTAATFGNRSPALGMRARAMRRI